MKCGLMMVVKENDTNIQHDDDTTRVYYKIRMTVQ